MCIFATTDHVIAPVQCKIKTTRDLTNFWHISNNKVANVWATFFYNAANAMPGILTTTRPQYTGERSRREGARKLCHLSRALVGMSKSIRFITQQWTLNHIITCLSKSTWWPHTIMQALLLP